MILYIQVKALNLERGTSLNGSWNQSDNLLLSNAAEYNNGTMLQ